MGPTKEFYANLHIYLIAYTLITEAKMAESMGVYFLDPIRAYRPQTVTRTKSHINIDSNIVVASHAGFPF
jgi:hypothetical protein